MSKRLGKKKIILGITGGFGSGKTTVARMFKKLGACCIDADEIYHQLITRPQPLYQQIVSAFGRGILARSKSIDRKKLAKLVFSDTRLLKRLCALTHPALIQRIRGEIRRFKQFKLKRIIIIDAPLLIEAGLIKMVDKLIVVRVGKKQQIQRCIKQWRLPQTVVIKRIKAQIPLWKKTKLADYVIDNSGSLRQTYQQVKEIWENQQAKNNS